MRRKLGIFIAALVAATGTLAVAAPAQAASGCPTGTGSFCGWDGFITSRFPDYEREWVDFTLNLCHGVSPVLDYIQNTSGKTFYVYTGSGCGGTRGTIYAHSGPTLMNSTFRNNIRGIKRIN